MKSKSLMIPDEQYRKWISDLSKRYKQSQIKASTTVNAEMLRFYWSLGRDIVAMNAENTYGSGFYEALSLDLRNALSNAKGFSATNLKYIRRFYMLYGNHPQAVDELYFLKISNIPSLIDMYPRICMGIHCKSCVCRVGGKSVSYRHIESDDGRCR